MSKAKEEYLQNKREQILDAAHRVCSKKYKIGFLTVELQDFKKGKRTMGSELVTEVYFPIESKIK